MANYYFNFDGCCVIEGEDREDARLKFWNTANPPSSDCSEWEYYESSVEPVAELFGEDREEEACIFAEKGREEQLDEMMSCNFPMPYLIYRPYFDRVCSMPVMKRGYDPWDHLEAKVALIRYMGPYRTI